MSIGLCALSTIEFVCKNCKYYNYLKYQNNIVILDIVINKYNLTLHQRRGT